MDINGSIALVTGANRGIGRAFVEELLKRGAAKIYVAARDTASLCDLVRDGDRALSGSELHRGTSGTGSYQY